MNIPGGRRRSSSAGMVFGIGAPNPSKDPTGQDTSSGRSQDPMANAADTVAKRAQRRSFTSPADLESKSGRSNKIFERRGSHAMTSHGAMVQQKRRASLAASMASPDTHHDEKAEAKDIISQASLRRASKQIGVNLADSLSATVREAAKPGRRRSTQLGAGIQAVDRSARRTSNVYEDAAQNMKYIRQMRQASQALRRASLNRGRAKEPAQGTPNARARGKPRYSAVLEIPGDAEEEEEDDDGTSSAPTEQLPDIPGQSAGDPSGSVPTIESLSERSMDGMVEGATWRSSL